MEEKPTEPSTLEPPVDTPESRPIEILPPPKNAVEEQLRVMGGAAFRMTVLVLEANGGQLVIGFNIGEGVFVCSSVDEAKNIRDQLTRSIEIVLTGKLPAPVASAEAVGVPVAPAPEALQ